MEPPPIPLPAPVGGRGRTRVRDGPGRTRQNRDKIMNIEDITIKQARELAAIFCQPPPKPTLQPHPLWFPGNRVFLRTVTHHHTGEVVSYDDHEIVLRNAAWIADDGRFANAVATGEFSEVEPFPDGAIVVIGRGSIVDAVAINALPRSTK